MVMNIANVLSAYKQSDLNSLSGSSAAKNTAATDSSFSNVLSGFMTDTVDSVKKSEQLAAQGAVGKADLQDVIMAVSNAEVMLQTVSSIRDKVVSAYQEVIRTSI